MCVIGGGLTGATAATALRLAWPHAHIELWDKAARFGKNLLKFKKT